MIPAGLIQIESLLKFEIKAKHWNPHNSFCWYTKNMQIFTKNTSTTLGMSDDFYFYHYLPFVLCKLYNHIYF